MNAQPASAPAPPSVCPLCGAAVADSAGRCESCGMTLAGVDGRPGPFSRTTFWLWAATLIAVYLVALVVVVLFPE